MTGNFAQEIGNQFHIKIRGICGRCRLVRETETEQIESVNTKVFSELVEVFAPHETGCTGADSVNKNNRWPGILGAAGLVKNASMFPVIESSIAAKRTIVGLAGVTLNGRVDCRQSCNAGAA